MLPTLNPSFTDLTAPGVGNAPSQAPAGAAQQPKGSFAGLLQAPVMVATTEPVGQGLPIDGNLLPPGMTDESMDVLERFSGGRGSAALAAFLTTGTAAGRDGIATEQRQLLAEEEGGNSSDLGAPALVAPFIVDSLGRWGRQTATNAVPASGTAFSDGTDSVDLFDKSTLGNHSTAARGQHRTESLPVLTPAADLAESVSLTTRRGAVDLPPGGIDIASGANAAVPTASQTASPSAQLAAAFVQSPPVIAASQSAGAPALLEGAIGLPVGDAGWGDSLGERIVFMTGNRIQNAEIRLTPAELGPIRVSVALEDGATSITFTAQHATTRDAIESAMPRLREMLAEQGLSLGDTSVADHGAQANRDNGGDDHSDPTGSVADELESMDSANPAPPLERRIARGLVDTFV